MSDTEPTSESSAPEMASSETHQPRVITTSRGWAIAAGALVALSVGAAATFGILWFSANSDLINAEHELVETQEKLINAKDELEFRKTQMVEYERAARYTACNTYHYGKALGTGLFTPETAMIVADSTCADESRWTFHVTPVP